MVQFTFLTVKKQSKSICEPVARWRRALRYYADVKIIPYAGFHKLSFRDFDADGKRNIGPWETRHLLARCRQEGLHLIFFVGRLDANPSMLPNGDAVWHDDMGEKSFLKSLDAAENAF